MPRSEIRTKHDIVAGVEGEMLKRIRLRNGMSRVELARELKLSPSTSGIYVDRLVREGILLERRIEERKRGRQPTILAPDARAGRFVGVDLEAHNIMAMTVDFRLSTVKRVHRVLRADASVEGILQAICASVRTVLKGDRRPLLGIGIGVPGRVDAERGTASDFSFIEGWTGVPIVSRLTAEFGVPVQIENNIRSMAMAELWFGQGFGRRNFVCLGIRTGIGAGVVAGGHLLTGEHGGGGRIGQWRVPGDGLGGGNGTTLEEFASMGAILRHASGATGRSMDLQGLRAALRRGDRTVLRVFNRSVSALAWAVDQLHLLFDPQRVVVVGPLADLGPLLLGPLREELRRRRSSEDFPEIVASDFGEFGGAYGAAALAVHQWKPAR